MQVHDDVRLDMLEVIKTSIEDGSADHKIVFKEGATILAEIVFSVLVQVPGEIKYKFIAPDGSDTLRAVVIADGRVSDFTIEGLVDGPGYASVLSGTIGSFVSQVDIFFNKQDWSEGASITLTNLTLILKQGT